MLLLHDLIIQIVSLGWHMGCSATLKNKQTWMWNPTKHNGWHWSHLLSPGCLFIHSFSMRQLMFSRNCKEHPMGVPPYYKWSASTSGRWMPSDACLFLTNHQATNQLQTCYLHQMAGLSLGSGVGSVGAGGKQFVLNSVSRDSLAVVQRDLYVTGVD